MGVKVYLFFDSLRSQLFVSLPSERVILKVDPQVNPVNLVKILSEYLANI